MTVIANKTRNETRKLNGQNQSGPSHFLAPFRVIHVHIVCDLLCKYSLRNILSPNNALPDAGQKPNWQHIKNELSSNLSPHSSSRTASTM